MFRFTPALLATAAALALVACDANDPTGPAEPTQVTAAPSTDAGSMSLTRLPKSFYVNPSSGKNTNPGTKLLPFKTLARALSSTIAKDTVRLAAGTYSAASGERFTNGTQQVPVPAGVMILGTVAGELTTRLQGAEGETGLSLKGGAAVRNLILAGFTIGIDATQGVQSLKGLLLDQTSLGIELRGTAQATLAGSTILLRPSTLPIIGVRAREQARFIMDGGMIGAESPNCEKTFIGVALLDAARLTLKNSATIKNIAGIGLAIRGTSHAILTKFAAIDRSFVQFPGKCAPRPSILTQDSASLTLRNARLVSIGGDFSMGVESNSRALLTIDSTEISGHSGAGIRGLGDFKLVASVSNFRQNGVGIDAIAAPKASITVSWTTLFLNAIGIRAPFFTLRNSVVSQNTTGIVVLSPFTDLGQTYDPGKNTITGNVITGVAFSSAVSSGGVGGIFASGNTWNALTQGSDGGGQYPGKPLVNNSSPDRSGPNFDLPANGFFQIQL